MDGPGTDGPGTDGPRMDKPWTHRPETDGPGTDGVQTHEAGTDGPGIGSCCVPAEVSVSHNHSVQRDAASPPPPPPPETVCTKAPPTLTAGGDDLSPDGWDSEKGSETETSLGRPLSTDALEEYGDMSTTGSAPSPPPQGGAATPADEDDEDFGDFGDAGSFAGQGFADFHQDSKVEDDNFGDFGFSKGRPEGAESASVPASDSFGNFSSAGGGGGGSSWSAFGEQQEGEGGAGKSWAEFSTEARTGQAEEEWHEVVEETSRPDSQPAPLCSRLTQLFQSSFPLTDVRLLEVQVDHLEVLLRPDRDEDQVEPGNRSSPVGVWAWLRDVHEALGLRYQWGGSHCNKALLGCLGIDTRNILFTGQKKQPIIVPMYAAGLGMLEPTKEPVKPISAAEMIASIAAPERSSCPADTVQETLPPVQFDWSSSGLTNPLDGVDPELFELTTTIVDTGVSGSRVADAFARLMSTMEKTSTSTRKPKRDENLSEEASKVITALPDLSFMQAKVLMFPATLMPLGTRATPD